MTKRAGGKNRTLYTQQPSLWRWAQQRAATMEMSLGAFVEAVLLQHKIVVDSLTSEQDSTTGEVG